MQGRCFGRFNFDEKKTRELGIYSEGVGRFLDCSTTKTSAEMANLKVYSRRSQNGPVNSYGGDKGVCWRCLDDSDDGHKTEDISSSSSQSLSDFSSDYSDLEGELQRRADETKEHIQEESEKAGLEGLRYLLGSHDLSLEGKTNTEVDLRERMKELDCSIKSKDKQGECSKGVLNRKV